MKRMSAQARALQRASASIGGDLLLDEPVSDAVSVVGDTDANMTRL